MARVVGSVANEVLHLTTTRAQLIPAKAAVGEPEVVLGTAAVMR